MPRSTLRPDDPDTHEPFHGTSSLELQAKLPASVDSWSALPSRSLSQNGERNFVFSPATGRHFLTGEEPLGVVRDQSRKASRAGPPSPSTWMDSHAVTKWKIQGVCKSAAPFFISCPPLSLWLLGEGKNNKGTHWVRRGNITPSPASFVPFCALDKLEPTHLRGPLPSPEIP